MEILNNYFWEIPKLIERQGKKKEKKREIKNKGTSAFIFSM